MTAHSLRPYQLRGKKLLEKLRYVLMLLPMGAGKTAICCSWFADWDMRVLVVAPLRVAETVWPVELKKWAPGVTCRVVTGTAARRIKTMSKDADVTIINYENFAWFMENTELDYDAIVFDELTAMKNWSSKRFKAYIKRRKKFNTFVGLTGTFTAKGVRDAYAQVRCIDGGMRLGRTLTAFRAAFMKKGYMDWDWTPKKNALVRIMQRISNITFTVTDEEYLAQLPSLVTNIIEVDMPKDARELYDELRREYVAEFGNDVVFTPTAAATNNKLQQIADGFAYTEEGTKIVPVHTAKLDALDEILESQQGAPTLIVYKYKHELAAMRKRHPGVVMNEGDAMTIVDAWNAGEIDILYGHPRSMGHGLNMQEGGNALVWFGHTWSYEEYAQVIARLLRSGQLKNVFQHLIMAKNTIDYDIRDRVDEEAANDNMMMTWLKERQA